MYQNTINNRLKPYNYNHDPKYFTEKEIDYVIEMIQKRESDFIKANLIKAFYFKSSLTLFKLVEYCELSSTRYYDQVMELYNEYNVENTLKLLIRSQKLWRVKDILVQTFKSIHKREEISDKIKSKLLIFIVYRNSWMKFWRLIRWKHTKVNVSIMLTIFAL